MNIEETITKANNGDVDAMIQLTGYYMDKMEINDAIDWADKAAESYNTNGMYKAATLHSFRMISLLKGGMPFWGVMREDAEAIQKNAGILLAACQKSLFKLEEDQYSYLLDLFRDALYCEAVTYYSDETDADYARVIHLLKEVDSPREQTLCGVGYYETKQYDAAIRILTKVYDCSSYTSSSKVPVEQAIYTVAMLALSEMTRIQGDANKAVSIMNRSMDGLTDDDMKALIRKELGKYKQTIFGSWKYNG